jgi:hypothetical protein
MAMHGCAASATMYRDGEIHNRTCCKAPPFPCLRMCTSLSVISITTIFKILGFIIRVVLLTRVSVCLDEHHQGDHELSVIFKDVLPFQGVCVFTVAQGYSCTRLIGKSLLLDHTHVVPSVPLHACDACIRRNSVGYFMWRSCFWRRISQ